MLHGEIEATIASSGGARAKVSALPKAALPATVQRRAAVRERRGGKRASTLSLNSSSARLGSDARRAASIESCDLFMGSSGQPFLELLVPAHEIGFDRAERQLERLGDLGM